MVMERWGPSALRARRPSRAVDEMERYMDEILAGWPFRTWRRLPAEELFWAPPIEMYEKDDKFVIRIELPGVNSDEIDICLQGDTLIIKGERKVSKEIKDEEYHRAELAYGSFSRSITLPAEVDAKGIGATYEDGILEVAVPKAKEAKVSKVQIKTKVA